MLNSKRTAKKNAKLDSVWIGGILMKPDWQGTFMRKPETGIEPSADNAIKASSAHIEIKLTDRKKIYSHGG